MVSDDSSHSLYLKSLFNSLEVNRKLFCNYLKIYANKRNASLTSDPSPSDQSEDDLLSYLDEVLKESVEDLRKAEIVAESLSNHRSPDDRLSFRDTYTNWKRDVALRIVIFKNLTRFDSLDLQRALFICLDSPYTSD